MMSMEELSAQDVYRRLSPTVKRILTLWFDEARVENSLPDAVNTVHREMSRSQAVAVADSLSQDPTVQKVIALYFGDEEIVYDTRSK